MNQNEKEFLTFMLGHDGAGALNRAVERIPVLKSMFLPRVILSWLSTMGRVGYEGPIAHIPDSYVSLIKTENNDFTGAMTINDRLYSFENQNMLHVAASLGVALGLEIQPLDEKVKIKDLSNLGKSIDLLVKNEVIKKMKEVKKEQDSFRLVQTVEKAKSVLVKSELQKIKRSIKKPEISKIIITKSESRRLCSECGQSNFDNEQFVACLCLKGLAKSINTEVIEKGYLLSFKNNLDEDEVSTIVEILKNN